MHNARWRVDHATWSTKILRPVLLKELVYRRVALARGHRGSNTFSPCLAPESDVALSDGDWADRRLVVRDLLRL